jgi:hypothetical protein
MQRRLEVHTQEFRKLESFARVRAWPLFHRRSLRPYPESDFKRYQAHGFRFAAGWRTIFACDHLKLVNPHKKVRALLPMTVLSAVFDV